jgi:hypothetical protein
MEIQLYHYTSREHAQGIRIAGVLLPSQKHNAVYLSPDLYDKGEEAANRLAIQDKPVEMVFAVPLLSEQEIISFERVRKVRKRGQIIRQGGGAEVLFQKRVPVHGVFVLCLRNP